MRARAGGRGTGPTQRGLPSPSNNLVKASSLWRAGQGHGAPPPERSSNAKAETTESWSPILLAAYGPQEVGLGLVRTALDILNNHYPERLKRVIFVNSGSSGPVVLFDVFCYLAFASSRQGYVACVLRLHGATHPGDRHSALPRCLGVRSEALLWWQRPKCVM